MLVQLTKELPAKKLLAIFIQTEFGSNNKKITFNWIQFQLKSNLFAFALLFAKETLAKSKENGNSSHALRKKNE